MKSKLWRFTSSGERQMSLIYSPSPWIQTFKQPTMSSVSLSSACLHQVALHPRYFPSDLPPMPPHPPFHPPLPGEGESRSSLRLRLQCQHPLALPTLLLVGGPVPLLALGAAVARHLAAAADVELPELQEKTPSDLASNLALCWKYNNYEQRCVPESLYRYSPV